MADRSMRALKENQPPNEVQNSKKQVDADSDEGDTSGNLPVKNTFIHFGSPSRTPVGHRGSLATPKTVPPHFAPEVSNASTAPIAPLRLFDFLPSPQVANNKSAPTAPTAPNPTASTSQVPALQAETITAMAAFHAVHAIFFAMPTAAMPPLPQLGGYQAQPQQYMWPAETSQPDMSQMPPLPDMGTSMTEGSFEDWSTWNWNQGETEGYLGMGQQDTWELERYDEV